MARTKISEFSATPASNTDIDSIFIGEGMAPSNVNDAIRELMAQLKDWQSGTSNDPYVVGSSGSLTLNQGTANGVPYLNGSKVVTSGSALTFNGTQFGVGTSSFDGNWTPSLQVVSSASDGTGGIMIESYRPSLIFKDDSASAVRQHIVADGSALIFGSGDASFTAKATLDSSGNLGLGVTPSAWGGNYKAIQFSSGAISSYQTNAMDLYGNAYDSGAGAWKYLHSSIGATRLASTNGQFQFYNAPVGTAGNAITFTQAMTLDANARLYLGSTSTGSARLNVGADCDGTAAGNSCIHVFSTNGAINGNNGGRISFSDADSTILSEIVQLRNTADTFKINNRTASGAITFGTNNTERARIDSSGTFLWAKTTASETNSGIQFGTDGTNIARLSIGGASSSSGTGISLYSTTAGAFRFFVSYAGQINATSTSITAISDVTLKENIRDLDTGLAEVMALRPRKFDWKEETQLPDRNVAGFIAQEVEQVLPELVYDYQYSEGVTKKSLKMGDILPTLVKAIQEQQAIIESLTTRITALEGQ